MKKRRLVNDSSRPVIAATLEISGVLFSGAARAEPAFAAPATPNEVETVGVTGSRLRRTTLSASSQTVTAVGQDLINSGDITIKAALQDFHSSPPGTIPQSTSLAAQGGSPPICGTLGRPPPTWISQIELRPGRASG